MLLFQLIPATSGIPPPMYSAFETCLRNQVRGSVFQPGMVDSCPGLLTPDDMLSRVQHQFESLDVCWPTLQVTDKVRAAVRKLQIFKVDCLLRGAEHEFGAPQWRQQNHRALAASALGTQRGGPLSKIACQPLLPDALNKETHMFLSSCLPSPYDTHAVLDPDVEFAIRAMIAFGPCIRTWRRLQQRAIRTVSNFLSPWEEALRKLMPEPVFKVASDKCPAMMTAAVVLLDWPDLTIGFRFVRGFRLLGPIESPQIFRPVTPASPDPPDLAQEFLQRAPAAIRKLEALLPQADYAQELLEHTEQEICKGWAEGFFSRQDLDTAFGPSRWLPMQRFMHVQGCGKLRPIDNGRSNGHNSLAWTLETIWTNTPDFAAASCRALMDALNRSFHVCPSWAQVVFGTEDMAHAYRQVPNMPEEAPGLVIGIWHPVEQSVKYAIMRAHPFGLASAVLNFNRLPTLATAATRQWTGTAVAGYFDDSGILDLSCARGSGQDSLNVVYEVLGVTLDPTKRQPMASQRTFLGVLLSLAGVHETQAMSIDVKPGLRESLMAEIDGILTQDHLSSGQASKLRGKFQWAGSAMYGRCARGGQGPLVRRQYESSDDITPELARSLKFMRALLHVIGPRKICLSPSPRPPVVLYTDASWEPKDMQSPGLGLVLMCPDAQPQGIACTIPKHVLEAFQERETQITPLEALAVLQASVVFTEQIAGRDVIWFCDNQVVCSALVRGSCASDDIASIVVLCHLLWASYSVRVWIEWVPSEANVSDGLSRSGVADEWTRQQPWRLGIAPCLPWHLVHAEPLLSAVETLKHWDRGLHWVNQGAPD